MKKQSLALLGTSLFCLALVSCAQKNAVQDPVSGAVSGVMTIDKLIVDSGAQSVNRSAALLGLYVAEYLTRVPQAQAADGALLGIGAQTQIMTAQSTVQDPDYDLIQAFGDALAVDVPDLLNRSTNRQEALEVYTVALTNIATRSNDRYKELSTALDEVKDQARVKNKERSTADRDLQKALREENFSEAAEKQKLVNDLQAEFSEIDLKQKQLDNTVETFQSLLDLYGRKILAIQSNREALIAGITVVDLPGVEDLDVLDKQKAPRRNRNDFDSLFDDTRVP